MPLSPPAADRTLAHTRRIELQGYARADGLFDVEATLADTKTVGFATDDRAWVPPGEPLHGMSMRMTVDMDMTIVAFEAVTDYSPFRICGDVAPNYARLVGLHIGRGFLRAAAERIGSTEGCTHLRELLQPMATVAYQTLYPFLLQRSPEAAVGQPALIDTCYAYRADGPVVRRRWPERYTGPADALS